MKKTPVCHLSLLFSALAGLLLSGCSFLIKVPPSEGTVTSFSLKASYGTEYAISVWVPPGLAAGDRVPALYVLDGDEAFDSSAQDADDARKTSGLKIIVVAIGYGSGENMRNRDYTPTYWDWEGDGGGCADFLDFISTVLVPKIETDYPAIRDRSGRAINGHSFGGLATIYAFLTKSDVFSGFIATSPSLWWDGNMTFDRLADFLSTAGSLPTSRLYLSVGSQEVEGMAVLMQEFASRIDAASIHSLTLKSEVFPNKVHWDYSSLALASGISFVFGGAQ